MQQRFLLQILLLAQHISEHHYAHHQELKRIIQWLLPVVFGAVVFMYNTLELLVMGIVVLETCPASNKICNKNCVASSWHFISTCCISFCFVGIICTFYMTQGLHRSYEIN